MGRFLASARSTPLWARWLATLLAFASVTVAIVIVVHDVNQSSASSTRESSLEVEANREGEVVLTADQAPHSARLPAGAPVRAALEGAIAGDARTRIREQQLTGPLQGVRCAPSGRPEGSRSPFRCTVRSAGIAYPFLGVVDERARTLTWCKRDEPPGNGSPLNAPISSRCRA